MRIDLMTWMREGWERKASSGSSATSSSSDAAPILANGGFPKMVRIASSSTIIVAVVQWLI